MAKQVIGLTIHFTCAFYQRSDMKCILYLCIIITKPNLIPNSQNTEFMQYLKSNWSNLLIQTKRRGDPFPSYCTGKYCTEFNILTIQHTSTHQLFLFFFRHVPLYPQLRILILFWETESQHKRNFGYAL